MTMHITGTVFDSVGPAVDYAKETGAAAINVHPIGLAMTVSPEELDRLRGTGMYFDTCERGEGNWLTSKAVNLPRAVTPGDINTTVASS